MPSTPLPLSLANLLLRPRSGSRRTPDRAFERLVARSGQADGDQQFVDDLRFLLRHWAQDPDLTPVGWQSAQSYVGRHLTNRARIRRLIAEHPAIEQESIDEPVFVTGLPRTATTLTHRVLSLSPAHRCPLLWELLNPDLDTPREREKAITTTRRMAAGTTLFAPGFRDIHPVVADGPEECTQAIPFTQVPVSHSRIPAYQARHHQRDFVADYRYLKQFYQVLQYGRPRRRWVLKSPWHIDNLDALRTVFPDATIVWTHRDPVAVVASFCSLVEQSMSVHLRPVDKHGIGANWLDLLNGFMARGMAARAAIPAEALVDVPYSWLGSDPATGAPKLYASVGARWTDADAARLPAVTARPRNSRPHSYDLSRYGLTRAEVESAFADYNALRAEVDPPGRD